MARVSEVGRRERRRTRGLEVPRIYSAAERGALAAAVRALSAGLVVAFPTETVYGLGVRYGDRSARARLARVKNRPGGRPFQILLSSRRRARELCVEWPAAAAKLAAAFWPGPLTLVLRSGRRGWVGLRVPDHPVARELARRAGGKLVATSANVSGRQAARSADEVVRALGGVVAVVLDGGRAALGKASSVVRVSGGSWELLREGTVRREDVESLIGSHGPGDGD